jgi:hypothetical protein
MQVWVERLSEHKRENTPAANILYHEELTALVTFFKDKSYGPYMACPGFPSGDSFAYNVQDCAVQQWTFSPPNRGGSALWVHTQAYVVGFNMHKPVQVDHAVACASIFFIVLIMIFSGLALSNVVTELAVRPLERMLKMVRHIAEQVFQFSSDMNVEEEHDEGEEFDINTSSEMKLLEKVVEKLSNIAKLVSGQGSPQITEGMAEEDIAALNMAEGKDLKQEHKKQDARRVSYGARNVNKKKDDSLCLKLEDAGVALELYNSFAFNTLELNKQQKTSVGVYCVMKFHEDAEGFITSETHKATLERFVAETESNYKDNPFHNFSHAVDVLTSVSKMMRLMDPENALLLELEQFSLLIAAIGHDVGHPGVNNPFLLEVGHELALQYNDLSPLENMHVSKLYSIVSVPEANVFSMLAKAQFKDVRKYCIETILHTDMAQHQGMINKLLLVHQMNLEIFTKGAGELLGAEVELWNRNENKMLVMENILHSADISNPCRVWSVTRAWAGCVLEEFFAQGDQERMIGIPVQPLNDRNKVNVPHSQIGFLEFMIAPFFAAQMRLFHKLHEYGDLLAIDLENWEEMWGKQEDESRAKSNLPPDDEARAKVKERVDKVKAKLEEAKNCRVPE